MGTEPLNIICTTDLNYFDHFLSLVRSIATNVTNYKLHTRLVHVNPEHITAVLDVVPDARIIDDKTTASSKKTIMRSGIDLNSIMHTSLRERMISERLLYCVYSKYDNAKLLLDEGCSEILVMDADGLVRKDLTDLHELIKNHDFTAREETRKPIGLFPLGKRMVSEGIMGFRNVPIVHEFVNRIVRYLKSVKGASDSTNPWDFDTVVISKLLDEMPDLDYNNLPDTYKDWKFDNQSHIWSGQGTGKSDPVYLEERTKYEN